MSVPRKAPLDERPVLLIADDDPLLSLLIGRHVHTLGFDALIAANGADALVLAGRRRALHCALLGYSLPRLDGRTVARGLRALFPELPLLFMLGDQPASPEAPGDDLAAVPVLLKPFTMGALREALATAVSGGGRLAARYAAYGPVSP